MVFRFCAPACCSKCSTFLLRSGFAGVAHIAHGSRESGHIWCTLSDIGVFRAVSLALGSSGILHAEDLNLAQCDCMTSGPNSMGQAIVACFGYHHQSSTVQLKLINLATFAPAVTVELSALPELRSSGLAHGLAPAEAAWVLPNVLVFTYGHGWVMVDIRNPSNALHCGFLGDERSGVGCFEKAGGWQTQRLQAASDACSISVLHANASGDGGIFLATGHKNGVIHVWEAKTGRVVRSIIANPWGGQSVCVKSDAGWTYCEHSASSVPPPASLVQQVSSASAQVSDRGGKKRKRLSLQKPAPLGKFSWRAPSAIVVGEASRFNPVDGMGMSSMAIQSIFKGGTCIDPACSGSCAPQIGSEGLGHARIKWTDPLIRIVAHYSNGRVYMLHLNQVLPVSCIGDPAVEHAKSIKHSACVVGYGSAATVQPSEYKTQAGQSALVQRQLLDMKGSFLDAPYWLLAFRHLYLISEQKNMMLHMMGIQRKADLSVCENEQAAIDQLKKWAHVGLDETLATCEHALIPTIGDAELATALQEYSRNTCEVITPQWQSFSGISSTDDAFACMDVSSSLREVLMLDARGGARVRDLYSGRQKRGLMLDPAIVAFPTPQIAEHAGGFTMCPLQVLFSAQGSPYGTYICMQRRPLQATLFYQQSESARPQVARQLQSQYVDGIDVASTLHTFHISYRTAQALPHSSEVTHRPLERLLPGPKQPLLSKRRNAMISQSQAAFTGWSGCGSQAVQPMASELRAEPECAVGIAAALTRDQLPVLIEGEDTPRRTVICTDDSSGAFILRGVPHGPLPAAVTTRFDLREELYPADRAWTVSQVSGAIFRVQKLCVPGFDPIEDAVVVMPTVPKQGRRELAQAIVSSLEAGVMPYNVRVLAPTPSLDAALGLPRWGALQGSELMGDELGAGMGEHGFGVEQWEQQTAVDDSQCTAEHGSCDQQVFVCMTCMKEQAKCQYYLACLAEIFCRLQPESCCDAACQCPGQQCCKDPNKQQDVWSDEEIVKLLKNPFEAPEYDGLRAVAEALGLDGKADEWVQETQGGVQEAVAAAMLEAPIKPVGICSACASSCHRGHETLALGRKSPFCCSCSQPVRQRHLTVSHHTTMKLADVDESGKILCGTAVPEKLQAFVKYCRAELSESIDDESFHQCFWLHNLDVEERDTMKPDQTFVERFCYCHGEERRPMIQCELCEDWFHDSCLDTQVNFHEDEEYSIMTMVCTDCVRMRMPFLADERLYELRQPAVPPLPSAASSGGERATQRQLCDAQTLNTLQSDPQYPPQPQRRFVGYVLQHGVLLMSEWWSVLHQRSKVMFLASVHNTEIPRSLGSLEAALREELAPPSLLDTSSTPEQARFGRGPTAFQGPESEDEDEDIEEEERPYRFAVLNLWRYRFTAAIEKHGVPFITYSCSRSEWEEFFSEEAEEALTAALGPTRVHGVLEDMDAHLVDHEALARAEEMLATGEVLTRLAPRSAPSSSQSASEQLDALRNAPTPAAAMQQVLRNLLGALASRSHDGSITESDVLSLRRQFQ